MAWTTPKIDWETGDLVSASDLNTIGDNFNALKDRLENNDEYTADESSEYSTSSTSFVDVDDTNLSHTITTNGGDVLVGFAGSGRVTTGDYMFFDVSVDDTPHFGDDGVMVSRAESSRNMGFVVLVTGLSAGEHTFNLMWLIVLLQVAYMLVTVTQTKTFTRNSGYRSNRDDKYIK